MDTTGLKGHVVLALNLDTYRARLVVSGMLNGQIPGRKLTPSTLIVDTKVDTLSIGTPTRMPLMATIQLVDSMNRNSRKWVGRNNDYWCMDKATALHSHANGLCRPVIMDIWVVKGCMGTQQRTNQHHVIYWGSSRCILQDEG